jgi:hypothetical protein
MLTFVIAAPASARQCNEAWVPGIGAVGANDTVNALGVLPTGELLVGGRFTAAGGTAALRLAGCNPATNTWSVASSSSAFSVNAIAVLPGGDALIGGSFTNVAGVFGASNIARYHRTSNTWTALATGLSGGEVNTIAVLPAAAGALPGSGNVLVGGSIAPTSPNLQFIGRFNQATSVWSALTGGGTADNVNALAVLPGGDLIVGGKFTFSGAVSTSRISRYNLTTNVWSALGAGTNGEVFALAVLPGGDVIVGGAFTTAGGATANRIARYNPATNTWSALGAGTNGTVNALIVLGDGDVLVGGTFTTAGPVAANNIARYNPSTGAWSALGAGTNGAVRAFAILPSGDVIIGGSFTSAGGSTANRIARYSPGVAAPTILSQPLPVVTAASSSAVFYCNAAGGVRSGSNPIVAPSYQWRKGGVAINTIANPSAATPALFLSNVQAADLGSYDCLVTNSCGGTGTLSSPATLSFVVDPCPADFNNDGFVDFTDFDAFVTEFEAGC